MSSKYSLEQFNKLDTFLPLTTIPIKTRKQKLEKSFAYISDRILN